jgi:CubicO group peptidase (beta-lactamase class C family)
VSHAAPTRRQFLTNTTLLTAAAFNSIRHARSDDRSQTEPTLTGAEVPGLESFDRLLSKFIREELTPGMSLAVARRGKLIYSRAAGLADREAKKPVRPDALFRIASVSKPITAVAVLQLVEQKKLGLDDPVLPLLQIEPLLIGDSKFDERWREITVRQCLQHTAGWDRDVSFDPVARPRPHRRDCFRLE